MASRRTRIKGIANIPQRKKTNQENNFSNLDTAVDHILPDSECNDEVIKKEELSQHARLNSGENVSTKLNRESPIPIQDNIVSAIEKSDNDTHVSNSVKCRKDEIIQSAEITNNSITIGEISTEISSDTNNETAPRDCNFKEVGNKIAVTNVPRRKFLKPGINLNAIKKRQPSQETTEAQPMIKSHTLSKDVIQKELSDKSEEIENNPKPNDKVVVISEIRIPSYETKQVPVACDITKLISRNGNDGSSYQRLSYSEVTLNETHLGVNEGPVQNSSIVTFSPHIKKVVPESHVSDSEYPPPPPSPSKINRSRIKAIPRLSQRKTSCSASESEDETRKYGRIRNNSVCSVVSTSCLEPPTPTSETVPSKDVTPNLPKKINRTEQSRKVAEARREFHKRFGRNSPDKQNLKMIDLIFYNPTSNPMSKRDFKPPENNTQTEKESKENVDDPLPKVIVAEEEEEKKKENDNSMPVPQIKIGPSGELIVDEQSLVVENVEVAKQKEQLRNSVVVNGDSDTRYGMYKRARRALSWNQKETVRFYKALNLIGTDFTVMAELFPKRNRRELKIKFKKEERINKQLIDRAIMQPCKYNFADLKREIEIEEEEEIVLQKLKEEEMEKMKQVQLEKLLKKKKKRKGQEADKNASEDVIPDKDPLLLPPKKRLKSLDRPLKIKPQLKKIKVKPLNIKSVLDDDSDADISDMETQSESEEEETIPFLKPTRSGRIPKSTERFTTIVDPNPQQYPYDPKKGTLDNEPVEQIFDSAGTFITPDEPSTKPHISAIRDRRSSSLSSLESNSDKLVPGSVVIIMEEDPDGKSEYKVFMVTPEKKMVPLELTSDIVAKLVSERQNEEDSAEFLVPPVPEKNVTIPASDEIVKSDSQKPRETLLINYPDPDLE